MTEQHAAILEAIRDTPAAEQLLADALARARLDDFAGMTTIAAMAADVLIAAHPELGDPIDLARTLAMSLAIDADQRAARARHDRLN